MKLSYTLLEKQNMTKLTTIQMDLLIYLIKHQNENGLIFGVHYSDVLKFCKMKSKTSFYSSLEVLEEYGLISYSRNEESATYTITITDNDFSSGEKDFKRGYINLNREVFHSKKFKKLKGHEKYLVFFFLKRTHENQASFKIMTTTLYKKLVALFKVSKKTIRGYMHNIRAFFSVGIIKGEYFITYKHNLFKPQNSKPERYFRDRSTINRIVHKLKIRNTNESEINYTTELIHQYRKSAEEKEENVEELIEAVVENLTAEVPQKRRKLDFKMINKTLSKHFREGLEIKINKQVNNISNRNPDGTYKDWVFKKLALRH